MTISCYFVGYPERSKGYQFYCPKFLEYENLHGSRNNRNVELIPQLEEISETPHNNDNNDTIILIDAHSNDNQIMRRLKRTKTSAVSDDYLVYLQEQDDMGIDDYP